MADTRRLDDGDSELIEYFHFDETTGGFTIETIQDVEPLVEFNKALYNETEKHTRYGEWTKFASWPPVITMQLVQKGIMNWAGAILDDKKFRQWANDPENMYFRTRRGRV